MKGKNIYILKLKSKNTYVLFEYLPFERVYKIINIIGEKYRPHKNIEILPGAKLNTVYYLDGKIIKSYKKLNSGIKALNRIIEKEPELLI